MATQPKPFDPIVWIETQRMALQNQVNELDRRHDMLREEVLANRTQRRETYSQMQEYISAQNKMHNENDAAQKAEQLANEVARQKLEGLGYVYANNTWMLAKDAFPAPEQRELENKLRDAGVLDPITPKRMHRHGVAPANYVDPEGKHRPDPADRAADDGPEGLPDVDPAYLTPRA